MLTCFITALFQDLAHDAISACVALHKVGIFAFPSFPVGNPFSYNDTCPSKKVLSNIRPLISVPLLVFIFNKLTRSVMANSCKRPLANATNVILSVPSLGFIFSVPVFLITKAYFADLYKKIKAAIKVIQKNIKCLKLNYTLVAHIILISTLRTSSHLNSI